MRPVIFANKIYFWLLFHFGVIMRTLKLNWDLKLGFGIFGFLVGFFGIR